MKYGTYGRQGTMPLTHFGSQQQTPACWPAAAAIVGFSGDAIKFIRNQTVLSDLT